ncbi:hypothetical protein LTR64_000384 [Lithohypha guttulata]|uniref:uncharacterized protein n=1 Tax=Lithohypha guttulata TaxID=1690604 RepID=UPI00315C5B0A
MIDDDDDDGNESLSSQKSELMRLDEEERVWLLVNYATLKRFQRFHVLMQFRYEDEVLFACHALQDLLQGKDVSLKPRLLVHTESEAERAACYLTAFQSFKYLRCSTFTIQGWPELKDIYSVITSQRSVPALLAQYVPFLRHLSTLPSLNDEVFELEHEIELEELKEHTVNPDPQKFREIVVQLVSKAEKWHTQSVEDEKARLEEERDLKLAAIADIVQLTEAELATSCEVQGSG